MTESAAGSDTSVDLEELARQAMQAASPTAEQMAMAEELCMFCMTPINPALTTCLKCGARIISPVLLG